MKRKIKILHLEDSLKDSELIHSLIEGGEIGNEYFLTDNEEEFIHILETEDIDIILSDYILPWYNGLEALGVAREKYKHIPFLFVSGAMGEDLAINAMLNGATDYVLKNKLERLVPAIKRALSESELAIRRKQAEEALAGSQERLFQAQKLARLGVWNWKADIDFVTWSEELYEMAGLDPQLPAPTYAEHPNIYTPQSWQILKTAVEKAISSREPYQLELELVRPDGSIRNIIAFGGAKFDRDGKVNELYGTVQDITELMQADLLIRESELKFRDLFENSLMGISEADSSGHLLNANIAYVKMYGYESLQEMMKEISDVGKLYANPEGRKEVLRILGLNGFMEPREVEVVKRDGTHFFVLASAKEVRDAAGRLLRYQASHIDITERIHAENRLRDSRDYLDKIINSVASPIFVKDDQHKFCLVNNALCSLLKLNSADLIGKTGFEHFPKDQVDVFMAKDQEVLNSGIENVNEESITDGLGIIRTIITRKTLYTDTAGNKCLVGIINDITERKKIEKEISRLNRIYAVLSNTNHAIVRINNKVELFKEICRIGIDDGKFILSWIGRVDTAANKVDVMAFAGNNDDYLNHLDIDLSNEILSNGPTGKAIHSGNHAIVMDIEKDKNMVPWRIRALKCGFKSSIALPLIVFGKVYGILNLYSEEIDFFDKDEIKLLDDLARDISFAIEFMDSEAERRLAEQALIIAKEKAQESDLLKTAFLQNMSHEIRTPLNGIIGFSGLLNDEDLSKDEIREYTDLINQSGKRLIEIVNNVLDISKIQTGQVKIEKNQILIYSVFSDLTTFFYPAAAAKNICLCFHNQDDKYTTIVSDEARLHQILVNLINNAIKFTKSGNIDYGFEIKNHFIEFYVKDSGIGIQSEMHDRIFERFIQAEQSVKNNYDGAGLGLAISKGLVELLGGKIRVESEPGQGSTFYFTLPFSHDEVPSSNGRVSSEIQANQSHGIILIAEDDLISFQYLQRILRRYAVTVLHAEDGLQAVNFVRNTPDIDLVLMDIRMPVMDGFEATKQIKQIRPGLPVIAQTAYAFSEEKSKILAIGCDDYLSKPLERNKVSEILGMYLN